MPFKWVVIFAVILAIFPLFVLSNNLPSQVQQALRNAGVSDSSVGVYVHEIGDNEPLFAVNAEEPMNPASVMKLVTTFAGLEILGPAYTWKTEIYANGRVIEGVLHGDLVIKGYGDPKLNLENFWLLAHRLRKTGLYKITGDLILDHSHYDIPVDDPGAFDGQPYRTYNILPEALLINYRTSTLRLIPQPETNSVQVVADPIPDSLTLGNHLKLTRGSCGDWRNLLRTSVVTNDDDGRVSVRLEGNYSINCGSQSYFLGLHDSSTYTRDLFQRLWTQLGGIFQGDVRVGHAPKGVSPIKIYVSSSLVEIIRGINKFSNNIAARQLYLSLGSMDISAPRHSPLTLEKSGKVIKQWLASMQLDLPELVIENGSGLSRVERISANHMGQLLLAAFHSSVMPEFISSMPIAAVDGTMRNRLKGSRISGLAHIKTGSLNNVRALAGYMLDQSGRRIVVVFFVNHPNAASSRRAMDELLEWLYLR